MATGTKAMHLHNYHGDTICGRPATCCGEANFPGGFEVDMCDVARKCRCGRCKNTQAFKVIAREQREAAKKKAARKHKAAKESKCKNTGGVKRKPKGRNNKKKKGGGW
jgi:hypothetical protein